ncbi:hypothetical protein ACYULU_14325 [Breznakiellaceae bacterium SP9]
MNTTEKVRIAAEITAFKNTDFSDEQPAQMKPSHLTSPKDRLLSLAGSISHEDYLEIEKALEDTEKVYPT